MLFFDEGNLAFEVSHQLGKQACFFDMLKLFFPDKGHTEIEKDAFVPVLHQDFVSADFVYIAQNGYVVLFSTMISLVFFGFSTNV